MASHIQKRVGSRLRKLKSTTPHLKGKGKLTDQFIDRLQNYYGIAIRSNTGNLDDMQTATIAAFFHCCSSKDHPMHAQCPKGIDSWCKYQKCKALGLKFEDKSKGLPQAIVNIVKPTYMELCDKKILKKCLHGKTQNANESFNNVLWSIMPKETFIELKSFQLGSYIAVTIFNNGFMGLLKILEKINVRPGIFTVDGYISIDQQRIYDSKRHLLPSTKLNRKKLKTSKKKKSCNVEQKEGVFYKSGEF